jgi:hypothetical protein
MTRVHLRPAIASAVACVAALVGCQLLVPGDVPEFRCVGSDPSACPLGLVCDTTTSRCVQPASIQDAGEERVVDDDPPDAPIDDAEAGPADIGGACINDEDCKPGLLCGDSFSLTSAIIDNKGLCTKPCCTSDDCPPSFVCFGAGTGGSYCVPADKAQRSPTGFNKPGEACDSGADCRSGLCNGGRCVDGCCSADDCAEGTTCRIFHVEVPPPARETWACAAPAIGVGVGQSCQGGVKCQNDNCAGTPLKCRPPCCNSQECVAIGSNFGVCAYGAILLSNTFEKWCLDENQKGPKALGESCSGHHDCESLFCDYQSKKCLAVCCVDEDCRPGEVCRPSPVTTPYLRCVPDER